MTSFTSSSSVASEQRHVKWWPAWLLALGLLILTVGIWETIIRSAALGPEYIDNRALWVSTRQRLSGFGTDAVAVLGASRVHRAIHPETLARELGSPVAHLAVEGTSAIPLLEDLAVDPRFRGTVLFSVAPAFSFNRKLSKLDAGNQAAWVSYYRSQSRSRRIEYDLRLAIQGLFAFRSPDASLTRVLPHMLLHGRLPDRGFQMTFADRSVNIDYTKSKRTANPQRIVDLYLENTEAYEADEFADLINYVSAIVTILRTKNCRVIFLRLPSADIVRDLERQMFPNDRFWGYMQQHIDAEFIHFEDYPQLAGYLSVDGSHIASEKSVTFTKLLADVIRK